MSSEKHLQECRQFVYARPGGALRLVSPNDILCASLIGTVFGVCPERVTHVTNLIECFQEFLTEESFEELLMGMASQISEREDAVLCSDVKGMLTETVLSSSFCPHTPKYLSHFYLPQYYNNSRSHRSTTIGKYETCIISC